MGLAATVRTRAASRRRDDFVAFLDGQRRPCTIIDLGGSHDMWNRWGVTAADACVITLMNNHHLDTRHANTAARSDFIREELGDMRDLRVDDLRRFDVVFSNSAIEHLESRDDQALVADTIVRSGRPYFIQVPDKFSPVDPHFPHPLVPFFAVYPKPLQSLLVRLHRFGSGSRSRSLTDARRRMRFYNPLGRADLHRLFPGSTIIRQSVFGLSTSLIAFNKR